MKGSAVRIAVLGASGFIGSAVCAVARHHGHEVVEVRAPRLSCAARGAGEVLTTALKADDDVAALADDLTGAQVVINAAGLATPGSAMTDGLIGANSLLPAVLTRAAARAGVGRVVHLSSAAVYGDARVLDPAVRPRPISPYGWSKLWGEDALVSAAEVGPGAQVGPAVIRYRPTSVHGPGRGVTEQIRRLARSPLSSVAAPGDDPTPQVMVEQVATFALSLATAPEVPTAPVIHPWEGWTTSSFLEHMGQGRRPVRIPRPVSRCRPGRCEGRRTAAFGPRRPGPPPGDALVRPTPESRPPPLGLNPFRVT